MDTSVKTVSTPHGSLSSTPKAVFIGPACRSWFFSLGHPVPLHSASLLWAQTWRLRGVGQSLQTRLPKIGLHRPLLWPQDHSGPTKSHSVLVAQEECNPAGSSHTGRSGRRLGGQTGAAETTETKEGGQWRSGLDLPLK